MELHQGSLFPFCKKADLEWIDSFEWWEVCMYDPAAQPLLHNWRWSLENSPTSHVKDQRQQQRIPTWKQLEESVFLHSESISGNSAHVCVCAKLLHLCLTLWHSGPLPTRFLSCGILQARILEWVVMPSSRGSSLPVIKPISPVSPALQWILYLGNLDKLSA